MKFEAKRQAGGTVMGLILGLIIGLSIAVWVAMTIHKTPLPFVDKLGKQAPATGDIGDPNKALPGGARAREKAPEDELAAPAPPAAPAAKPTAASATPAPAAPAVAASQKKPAEVAKPADGKPPVVERSKASSAATVTTTAPAVDDKFTYYLQAGAFREMADAEAARAKLALMGVSASVAERRTELGSLYRVRVGPFAEVEAMNRARTRLSDNGVDAAVVRVPK